MTGLEKKLKHLEVVKRKGKKVPFDGTKIAVAIKKGFDSVVDDEGERVYSEEDIIKVYDSVVSDIEKSYKDSKTIKIEDIQDLIEKDLQNNGYDDVHDSFSNYRDRRKI